MRIGFHGFSYSFYNLDDFDRYCESSGKTQPHDQGWEEKRPVINVS